MKWRNCGRTCTVSTDYGAKFPSLQTAYVLSAQGPDSKLAACKYLVSSLVSGILRFGVGETFLATALVLIPRELGG